MLQIYLCRYLCQFEWVAEEQRADLLIDLLPLEYHVSVETGSSLHSDELIKNLLLTPLAPPRVLILRAPVASYMLSALPPLFCCCMGGSWMPAIPPLIKAFCLF